MTAHRQGTRRIFDASRSLQDEETRAPSLIEKMLAQLRAGRMPQSPLP